MGYFWRALGVVCLMALGTTSEMTANADEKPAKDSGVVLGEQEAPRLIMTAVKTDKEILLGWRGELINMSQDKDLIVVMREKRRLNCRFEMTTAKGEEVRVGYPKEDMMIVCGPDVRDYRLVRVEPGAGHTWFVAAPDMQKVYDEQEGKSVQSDLPKGRYKIAVTFAASYFCSAAGDMTIPQYPKYPPYRTLTGKSDVMEAEMDPDVRRSENLERTYLRQKKASVCEEQKDRK